MSTCPIYGKEMFKAGGFRGGLNEVEDENIIRAVYKSYQTGTLTPILKEEIKYRIHNRRIQNGLSEIKVDFNQPNKDVTNIQLRPEEIEKIQRRKEQNRKAARKFRLKQKLGIRELLQECQLLEGKNTLLRNEICRLTKEKEQLQQEVITALTTPTPVLDNLATLSSRDTMGTHSTMGVLGTISAADIDAWAGELKSSFRPVEFR